MAFEDDYPELADAADMVFDMLGDLKLALADGRVTVDEIVGMVSDGGLKQTIRDGLNGLGSIPGEVAKVISSPWALVSMTQYFMGRIGKIFK